MKKRKLGFGLATAALMFGASLALAPAANAGIVNLYDDAGYGGAVGISASTWFNDAAVFNDRASSLTHTGTGAYFENIRYRGRSIQIQNSSSDLTRHPYPVGLSQNWNDRISSFR